MNNGLKHILEPESVAVVGVSPNEKNLATVIFKNIQYEFSKRGRAVYAVNPLYEECAGVRCNDRVPSSDLVIIAVPASLVKGYVKQAEQAGAKAAIVISGGFKESGGQPLLDWKPRLRVLGPNTIGVVNPHWGLNTLFLPHVKEYISGEILESIPDPAPGDVAIVAQSGALSITMLDDLTHLGVGLRGLVCTGNSEDISGEEAIEFFSEDGMTRVIAVYLEGVKDGRLLMRAVKRAKEAGKDVIAIVGGITDEGRRATGSHTASMIRNSALFTNALKQAGAYLARSYDEAMAVAALRSKWPTSRINSVVILSNSGGAGVLASDELGRNGVPLAEVPQGLIALRESGLIPRAASVKNPIDLTASGTDESFLLALDELCRGGAQGLIIIATHYPPGVSGSLPEKISAKIKSSCPDVPVVAVEVGSSAWSVAYRDGFMKSGIMSFSSPESAARALSGLYALPRISPFFAEATNEKASVSAELDEIYSMVEDAGFSRLPWGWINGEDDLKGLPYPIVLKVQAAGLVHKQKAGGVITGIRSPEEASAKYRELLRVFPGARVYYQRQVNGFEIRVGFVSDETFGTAIDIGYGGIYTEKLPHVTYVAPITESGVKSASSEAGISIPDSLAKAISRLSFIIAGSGKFKEFEINPVIVSNDGYYPVDIKYVL